MFAGPYFTMRKTNFPNKDSCGQLRKWETNVDSPTKFIFTIRFATETNNSSSALA